MNSKKFALVLALIAADESIKQIELAGPIADRSAELSGLAWHSNTLILLPQYPERFGEVDGALFALPKQDIENYLDGKSSAPLTPTVVKLTAPGLKESIPNFQGYESIGFHNDQVFMTIEAGAYCRCPQLGRSCIVGQSRIFNRGR